MLKYLFGLLLVLNILDIILTNSLVALGIATEGNPLLAPLIGQPWFVLVKVIGLLVAGILLWDISRRHLTLAKSATSCFVVAYSGIVAWNFSLLI